MSLPVEPDLISVVRSKERLRADVHRVPVIRAVLRKVIVSEERTVTITVRRETFEIEYEPIDRAGDDVDGTEAAVTGPVEPVTIVLHEERVELVTTVVPVERVLVAVQAVIEQRELTGQVRVEQVDIDGVVDAANTEAAGRHRG